MGVAVVRLRKLGGALLAVALVGNVGCHRTLPVSSGYRALPVQPCLDENAAQTVQQPREPQEATPPIAASPPSGKGYGKLDVPSDLPGSWVVPLELPKDLPADRTEREKIIRAQYPPLPPLGENLLPQPPQNGAAATLHDLQRLANANHPALKKAQAEIEVARGEAIQAGLYPNPTIGYQGDQMQPGTKPSNNAGQQGVFLAQRIVTAGKLQLARAAAGLAWLNAEVNYRRTQIAVATEVRRQFFAVLVAQENIRIHVALIELADEVFRGQVAQVVAGQAALYEPLQLYVFAISARNSLIQARNRYLSAWKQLAVAVGLPESAPTLLAGNPDSAIPRYAYDRCLERMLQVHPDLIAAENEVLRARFLLRLAEVTPIPDIEAQTALQRDTLVNNFQINLQIGMNVPIWNRNQGGILQAQGQLAAALQQVTQVRNQRIADLAQAFERYENARLQLQQYRQLILPNQVRIYRSVYQRYQQEPDKVNYNDVAIAHQAIAQQLSSYLTHLGAQWEAVVELAELMQLDDLYELTEPTGEDASASRPMDSWPVALRTLKPSTKR